MAKNLEISLISLILITFILTPLIPNNILFFIDHPIIRIALIIAPFALMNVSYLSGLLGVLCAGALFLERNRRKINKVNSSTWWNSVDGEPIPEPLVKLQQVESRKTAHQEPYMPEGLDQDGCEEESPVVQSDLEMRPVFETIHGDSSLGNEINGVIGNIRAPMPMSEWSNASDANSEMWANASEI
jgi:hypothetical protein